MRHGLRCRHLPVMTAHLMGGLGDLSPSGLVSRGPVCLYVQPPEPMTVAGEPIALLSRPEQVHAHVVRAEGWRPGGEFVTHTRRTRRGPIHEHTAAAGTGRSGQNALVERGGTVSDMDGAWNP